MLDIFDKDQDFFQYYINQFPLRFTENCFSSYLYYIVTELKKSNPTIKVNQRELDLLREQTLECNANVVNFLFNNTDGIDKLYPHHIQQVAYLINEQSGFAYGYRKTAVAINKDVNFIPCPPRGIPSKMLSLIDNYHNIWNIRDPFEREALFHITLAKIQPFEDGNKRTAQFLTSFNLLKSGFAPILVKQEDKDKYINFIGNDDVNGLSLYLRKTSMEELKYINNLYIEYLNDKENMIGAMSK